MASAWSTRRPPKQSWARCRPTKAGVGSAVNDTARELGGTLGVAIIGSLFASVYSTRLGELLTGSPVPASAQAIAGDSVGAGIEVARRAGEQAGPQAGAAVKAAVDSAFIDGFRAGSWVSAGVVLVGAMIAFAGSCQRHAVRRAPQLPAEAGRSQEM